MKRKLLLFLCFLAVFLSASAKRTGSMTILGRECNYDTLSYRTIAPGAKLLQLKFDSSIRYESHTYTLLAHVIEIDMTNPNNKFTTKLSHNGYHSWTTILEELQTEQKAGQKAVASITGFAFVESGNTSGSWKSGEPTGSMIGDGVVYHHNRSGDLTYYYGKDRMAYVANTHMSGNVIVDGTSWKIGQVNRSREFSDSYGEISLFCNGMPKSQVTPANMNSGTDVIVKLLNSDKKIIAGEEIECEVVSVVSGGGHNISDGQAILSGTGTAAANLNTLTPGKKIKIAINICDASNQKLDVAHLAPQFMSYAVRDGATGSGGIFNEVKYSVGILGVSQDHKKTYIGVMDQNRSECTCLCFADMMKNLGVYNGFFLDGGPSTDMAVDDKVISDNLVSYAGGRPVGSCYMLYSVAPTDNTISKIELDEYAIRELNVGSEVVIKAWGFNQYDEMICADALTNSGVTATCTNALGYFQGNKFFATKEGKGEIVISAASGYQLRIPVTVNGRVELHISPARIYTGNGRACQATLYFVEHGDSYDIDPTEAVWYTSNTNILESVENGLIKPRDFGTTSTARVSAQYRGLEASVNVTIDDLEELVDRLDLMDQISGGKQIACQLKSVPRSFTLVIETDPNHTAKLNYSTAFYDWSDTKTADGNGRIEFKVDLDYNNVATYPVTVHDIETQRDVVVKEFYATYNETTGINSISTGNNSLVNYGAPATTLSGQRIILNPSYRGIVIQNGKKVILK